ncbi:hypothetical protein HK104_008864 [Borealophlyctis nickersoniae]|nr:hypothetical protein HK104_008864 [Borealophlyctis nickersoniae]
MAELTVVNVTADKPGSKADAKPDILLWKDIKCTLPDGKVLLDGINGWVESGQVMAIMGPSGAGKSTFLDALADRRRGVAVEGLVTLNGSKEFKMSNVSSYVEQDDALFSALTVEETLYYAARLHFAFSESSQAINARVEQTLTELGLTRVKSSLIGNPLQRGISGGQKRRATIGTSSITRPRILFLDEPTSGLDSDTAFQVLSLLRNIAREEGIAVIATVHQPSLQCFNLFDRLLLLADAKTVYLGPADALTEYCAEGGFPVPAHMPPADHALHLINADFREIAGVEDADFAALWTDEKGAMIKSEMEQLLAGRQSSFALENMTSVGMAAHFSKTVVLVERSLINYRRNLIAYGVRMGMYVGMGLMLGLVWINLGQSQERLQDRISVHFFSVAFLAFMSVAGIPAFLEERSVFLRERANGLYGPGAYAIANTVVAIPFLFACALVFALICYWAIGLQPGADHFFQFVAYLFLAIYAAESQVILVAALLPIFIAALAIAAFANGFWMVVQGYFMRNLPKFWQYSFHYMDYQMYSFQLLMNEDLAGTKWTCGTNPAGKCQCAYYSQLQEQGECAFMGDDVLESLNINNINYGHWVVILIAIIVIFRILFYLAIKYRR